MEGIELHEETYEPRIQSARSHRRGLADWLVARGYAQDLSRANTYLVAGAALAAVVAIGVWQIAGHSTHETLGGGLLFERMPHAN